MKVPTGAVVALADGGRQLILINRGDEDVIDLRRLDDKRQHIPPDRALGGSRPGRFHSSRPQGGGPESADLHERAELEFAAALMKTLHAQAERGDLRHLVIAADPGTLGEMRAHYSAAIRRTLLAEIPRDLLKLPLPDIQAAISEWQPG